MNGPSQAFNDTFLHRPRTFLGSGRKEVMLRNLPLVLALLLASCGEDVRNRPLADVDLSNIKFVHQLARDLGSTDGAALINYADIHDPGSTHFCGERLVDARGEEPKTIGGAIDLTLARVALTRAGERTQTSETPAELIGKRLEDVAFERDMVSDRESFLLADHGLAAKQLPEWRSLESKKANLNQTLTSLQLQLTSLKDDQGPAASRQVI